MEAFEAQRYWQPFRAVWFASSLSSTHAVNRIELKIVASMLRHYTKAAASALRGGARHCYTVWQPQVMRCTASAAAALRGGSSSCVLSAAAGTNSIVIVRPATPTTAAAGST